MGKDFDAAEKEELLTNLERVLPPVMNLAVPEKGKQPGTTVDTMPCTMDNIPSAAQIYKSSKMKTNVERFWRTNATGTYALFLALKNGWLEEEEDEFGTKIISTANVQATSPIIDIMFKSVRKLRGVDFSSLTKPRLDYASQKEIAHSRVILLSACAVHFDLDFGLMVRFLRNEYTSPHRDEKKLEEDVSAHVSDADMKQMIRVLTKGCPHDLDYELPHEEKRKMIKRGNASSVTDHIDIVKATLNKEERNSHVVPLFTWLCHASLWANINAQAMVLKMNAPPEDSRLVWNGTTKIEADDIVMNDIVPLHNEAPITFGFVLLAFMTYIFNTRVSYPHADIDIASTDIKACHRWLRIFPDFVGAFGFLISGLYYFLTTAMVFGSRVSASSWEPFRRAIEAMTANYSLRNDLVSRYDNYLQMISFEEPAPAGTNFVIAPKCELNPGVLDENGNQRPIPTFIFVDDCLLATVRLYMKNLLCGCIHAIFVVLGFPDINVRQCPLAMNKWIGMIVGHRAILLGLVFDSRALTVGITDDYRAEVLKLLNDEWPSHVKKFTLHKLVRLAGKCARLGQGAIWVFHLLTHMYSSMSYAIKKNGEYLMGNSAPFRQMMKKMKGLRAITVKTKLDVDYLNFYVKKSAQKTFKCDETYFIVRTLRAELELLRDWLQPDSGIIWETPLGHIIKRIPYAIALGDACLYGGGGFCIKLQFWWHLSWPDKIIKKTKLHLVDNSNGDFVSINVLEFLTIIINYAAALTALLADGHDSDPFPVLLNFADNTSSVRWTNHHCKGSLKARALGRLFCGLLANSFLGINAKWLSGESNDIADAISRIKAEKHSPSVRASLDKSTLNETSFDYSQLKKQFPVLKPCRLFQPSKPFLSALWQAVLTEQLPNPKSLLQMRRKGLGVLTS